MKCYIACWTVMVSYDEPARLLKMKSFVDASEAVRQSLEFVDVSTKALSAAATEELVQEGQVEVHSPDDSQSAYIKLVDVL